MKNISKSILWIVGTLLVVYVSYYLISVVYTKKSYLTEQNSSPYYSGTSYDATYMIDNQKVTLDHGKSEVSITNSSSKIITRYFGNAVQADFDKDGRTDDAFIITQETGGSGTFFYFVARLNKINGPVGSDAFFIGDRIAPQTTEINNGKTSNGTNRENVIVVNYADRNANEPMSTKPSVGKSIWLKLDTKTMKFGEVAPNFEGESNL